MKQTTDTRWQRNGTSWIWDEEARNTVCVANEVWSLRRFLRAAQNWPEDLPSNDGNTLVVAGLDAGLDLLAPVQAEEWLGESIKGAILSFQTYFQGEASLIFWLPSGHARLKFNPANDSHEWCCAPPYRDQTLPFSRVLWGEANEYPQEILLKSGGKAVGLFHLRIT